MKANKTEQVLLPPERIIFQGIEYWLDMRIQLTPLKKEIKYSGIRVNEEMPNLYGRRHWIYTFIYLDGSGIVEFERNYDNNIKIYAGIRNTD